MSRWGTPLTPAIAALFAASLLFKRLRALLPTTTWTNIPPLADLLPHTAPQQVAATPVENGVGLHLPYQKHIWQVQQPSTIAAKKLFTISERNDLSLPPAQVCFFFSTRLFDRRTFSSKDCFTGQSPCMSARTMLAIFIPAAPGCA